jgi:hypothetical protein
MFDWYSQVFEIQPPQPPQPPVSGNVPLRVIYSREPPLKEPPIASLKFLFPLALAIWK